MLCWFGVVNTEYIDIIRRWRCFGLVLVLVLILVLVSVTVSMLMVMFGVVVGVGVVVNAGYHQEMAVLGSSDQENRRPRLKMFKLKCLNKVASFSLFK